MPIFSKKTAILPQPETSTMTDEQLCKELARFHQALTEKNARNRTMGSVFNAGGLTLHTSIVAGMTGITIMSAGTAAPVTVPVIALSLLSYGTLIRETARPELRDKRFAYVDLLEELNIKHGKILAKPIPFTEEAKNLEMIRTLVRIGKGKISPDEANDALSKIDRSFIQHCKTKVTQALEMGREAIERINMGREDTHTIEKQNQQPQNSNTVITGNPLHPNPTISSTAADKIKTTQEDKTRW